MSNTDWVEEAVAGLPALVTVEELCTALRTSRRQAYRLLATARIRSVKQAEGGSARHLIPRAEIARYLRSLQVDGRAAS